MNNSTQQFKSRGFTLIELMIVLTIIAILVTVAIPAYKDFTVRSKITECVNGAAVAKLQISEYRQSLGDWPLSDAHASIDTPAGSSQFCVGFSNYDANTGAFTVDIDENTISDSLGDISPVFTPTELTNNIINWSCSSGTTPPANIKYLPGPCRDG